MALVRNSRNWLARALAIAILAVLIGGCETKSEEPAGTDDPSADESTPAADAGASPAEEADTAATAQATETGGATATTPAATAPAGGEPDPADDAEVIEALEALGYVDDAVADNPEVVGVTVRDIEAGNDFVHLYSSRWEASAVLVDMAGEVVHRWRHPGARSWMHVEPYPNGDILILSKDSHLEKRNWESKLLWRQEHRLHHDILITAEGDIWTLTRAEETVAHGGKTLPILGDYITVLDSEGKEKRSVALVPLVRSLISNKWLDKIDREKDRMKREVLLDAGGFGDVLHTNSLEFLHVDLAGIAPAGSILISMRSPSRLAILDREMTKMLWYWGSGELDGQHDARQLDNGNILTFDNGLRRGRPSRVIEIDPRTNEVVWTTNSEVYAFYSNMRGGAQPVANGNILITESEKGHAFELDRDLQLVWEFWNPDVREDTGRRAAMYRFNRFPRAFFEPLAAASGAKEEGETQDGGKE